LPYFCHADDRKHPDPFIHGKEERDPSFLRMTRTINTFNYLMSIGLSKISLLELSYRKRVARKKVTKKTG